MANISYWHTFWVDSGETGLLPGQEHYWTMWGFGFLDVLAVTPGPLNSAVGDQILMVKDVRSEADSSGGRGFTSLFATQARSVRSGTA